MIGLEINYYSIKKPNSSAFKFGHFPIYILLSSSSKRDQHSFKTTATIECRNFFLQYLITQKFVKGYFYVEKWIVWLNQKKYLFTIALQTHIKFFLLLNENIFTNFKHSKTFKTYRGPTLLTLNYEQWLNLQQEES